NMELFPGQLFGKAWLLDGKAGLFNRQPGGPLITLEGPRVPVPRNVQENGPVQDPNGQVLAAPLATGPVLTIAPEAEVQRIEFRNVGSGELRLLDGRSAHPNGWCVLRPPIPAGATTRAIEGIVTPTTNPQWT